MTHLTDRRRGRAVVESVRYGFSAAILLLAQISLAQPNVLTSNYDNQRTNQNLQESILNSSNVVPGKFGKIGAFPLDGQLYAQPLYVANVQITGKGAHNVVYVATMHNSVYAIDADSPQSTTSLWQVNLGTPVPSSVLNFHDVVPEVGILSTPVIDISRQAIYLVTETLENNIPVFRLHALALADGREILNGPVVIAASVLGAGDGSVDGTLAFDPMWELQRPGLALANGSVYLSFGSHADDGDFHGWMLAYDAGNLPRQTAVFNTTPDCWGGSIWQASRAPAIDADGNLFVVSGNGHYDGITSFGESMLKLSPALSVLDYFTPSNWMQMRDDDEDFSTGVILVPGTNLAIGGAKTGFIHLVQRDSMGHIDPANANNLQTNIDFGIFSMAAWSRPGGPIVYVQNQFESIQAYSVSSGTLNPVPLSQSPAYQSLSAGLAITANGASATNAILWATTGDVNTSGVAGTLHAFDASDLSNELWNSDMSSADTLGRFAKFVAPTVVNGRVYAPTFSNSLVIYGLISDGGMTNEPTAIAGVVNGASFAGDSVSPGELVAIFGSNLGPPQLSNLQFDASGRVSSTLSETQVLFDGVPAPMIYTSANQVGAIAPFGLSASQTTVQVRYQGRVSSPITMSVVPATPALFALDGTGGGQGAIVNPDGTTNMYNNPASRGSVVLLYGTGAGQISPAAMDGQVTQNSPFPRPILPVSVEIDGQQAEVLYAGAAPGFVAGVLQINVRIPDTASTGEVQVVMHAGPYRSPSTVTIWVQ